MIRQNSLKFQESPDDGRKFDLYEKCKQVTDSLQSILGIMSVSSASAQAAHKLNNQIQSIMSDLETEILFAQSGMELKTRFFSATHGQNGEV